MRRYSFIALPVGLAALGLLAAGAPRALAGDSEETIRALEERIERVETRLGDEDTGAEGSLIERAVTGLHFGAGLSTSYMYNFNEPESDENSLRSLVRDHNEINLTLLQLSATRDVEEGVGFVARIDFGEIADAVSPTDTDDGDFVDLQEAYFTYATGSGLELKAGKFVTLLGAEVIEPWANPTFSRSFLFGLAIPFTHVGLLASYALADNVSVTAGIVNGWDVLGDNNDGKSYMGSVAYTFNDDLAFSVNGIYGPEQDDTGASRRAVVDLVLDYSPMDQLRFLLNYDYGEEGAPSANPDWQGFSGIVEYEWTDRFSTALRGEWFFDNDGTTRTGVGLKDVELWEVTLAGKCQVTDHLFARLEYRHDESDEKGIFEADDGRFFSGQDTIALDMGIVF